MLKFEGAERLVLDQLLVSICISEAFNKGTKGVWNSRKEGSVLGDATKDPWRSRGNKRLGWEIARWGLREHVVNAFEQ